MRRGNRPGSWQPPALRAMVRAWPRQRRNAQPSDPQPGGSYDTRRPWHFAIACSRVQRLCRQLSSEQVSYRAFPHRCENLLTPLFLLSKSNPLRWASIWFETDGREYPHTAFVLTKFKTKERQVPVDRVPQSWKCLCSRGSGGLAPRPNRKISPEIQRKQPICQWVDCAHWDYL